jgi:hypothetical protein
MERISYALPTTSHATSSRTIGEVEALLEQWFGRPVVLTSSGRSALLLCLRELGLQRYEHRVAMPPLTGLCVYDAICRAAFPVDPATDHGPVDATVLIHQYGLLLKDRPSGPVIEDICHAFFAGPATGERDWVGDMAVFSLPKFFRTSGMIGGIVAADCKLADALRQRRNNAPQLGAGQIAADQAAWRIGERAEIEQVYLRALLYPACSPDAFGLLPSDCAGLRQVGERRKAVTHALLDAIPTDQLDPEWRAMCATNLPFALPMFGPDTMLSALIAAARDLGVEAGVYRLGITRTMASRDLSKAALLPCHDQIEGADLASLCAAIREVTQLAAREGRS